jgi:histone H3/H4
LLDKKRLDDLVKEVDPHETLEEDVKDALLQLTDEFVDKVLNDACRLAKHRDSDKLEAKDVQLVLGPSLSCLPRKCESFRTQLEHVDSWICHRRNSTVQEGGDHRCSQTGTIGGGEIPPGPKHTVSLCLITKLRILAGGQKILPYEQNFGKAPTRKLFLLCACFSRTDYENMKWFVWRGRSGRCVFFIR